MVLSNSDVIKTIDFKTYIWLMIINIFLHMLINIFHVQIIRIPRSSYSIQVRLLFDQMVDELPCLDLLHLHRKVCSVLSLAEVRNRSKVLDMQVDSSER